MLHETQTGNDKYPHYKRRTVEDGGKSTVIKFNNVDIDIDNRWFLPYSPLLQVCKMLNIVTQLSL